MMPCMRMWLGIRVNAVAPGPIWTPLIPATHTQVGTYAPKHEM
jgi:NAD(P)-dependent dehydrogenase (short-subunit alcohol dehydrogenase family)